MIFFRKLPSVNRNFDRESNHMLQLLYLYVSGSAILVSFTNPNKRLPTVKSVLKSLDYRFIVWQIYKFTEPKKGLLLLFTKGCTLNFASCKGLYLIKVGAKLLFYVVIFSILSSESSIDFHDKTLDPLGKNLKYFLYEKYIKWFYNFPKEKCLVPLRILYPFIKSFVSPFVDNSFMLITTLFDSSFNSFPTSTCFVLFELIVLFKSVFYHFCLLNLLLLILQQKSLL